MLNVVSIGYQWFGQVLDLITVYVKKTFYVCTINYVIYIYYDCFDEFNLEEIPYVPTDYVVNTTDNEIELDVNLDESINSDSSNSEKSITEFENDDDDDDNDNDDDDFFFFWKWWWWW